MAIQPLCAALTTACIVFGVSASVLSAEPYSPTVNETYPDQLLFGDTHVHTGLSTDAGGSGTKLMPRDAYRFARGEQVTSNTGQPIRLSRPYDFFMITDHSDGMGAIIDIFKGTPNVMADPEGKRYHEEFSEGGATAQMAMFRLINRFAQGQSAPFLREYRPGSEVYGRVWKQIVDAAEEFNAPGEFTTFIAYEWTSLVKGNNLHRNVIYRDNADKALQMDPYTTQAPIGSLDPRDLWVWMENYEQTTGGQVTAIPHNGNLSNGFMFPLVDTFDNNKPLDEAYARSREKWERVYEATQFKGDGEAHPLLSPEDEFADFETWDYGNLDVSQKKQPEHLPGEYVRSGLLRGLELQATLGVNPFKFGLLGSTDTHTGLSTPDEDNFFGKFTTGEPAKDRASHAGRANEALDIRGFTGWQYNSAGLTAVWAEENTRPSIFDALERRETYATTGPRIGLRFFGGRNFTDADANAPNLAATGYAKGVPMGSDLPAGKDAPTFLIAATRDPQGANLDRVQVVKGWLTRDGRTEEQIYDVAWSDDRVLDDDGRLPPVGNTVDLSIPTWSNSIGASELRTVWQDPDFDASQAAFYYVRVIEIPTPRWTAYDAVRFGITHDKGVQLITQERAYSSPIWHTAE